MTDQAKSTNVNTITKDRVDELGANHDEPKWLKHERAAAWELYLQTATPTSRDEEWRQTEIDTLSLSNLDALNLATTNAKAADLPEWFKAGLAYFENPSATVALFGQKVFASPLPEQLVKEGVIFCDLKEAVQKHGELVRRFLDSDSPKYASESIQSKFALLNRAMFNGGLFLYVPDNVVIDRPFIGLIAVDESKPYVNLPRTFVAAGKHSKVQFVQAFISEGKLTAKPTWSLSNALVEIFVEAGGDVEYVEVQNFDANVFAVSETHSAVGRDAKFASFVVALGGGQVKGDVITTLQEAGAESKVLGVVLGDAKERFSFNTIQEHNSPDTKSDINFRVALKGESMSIYQGIIKVAKVAQRTEAFQSNKNLLLSGYARADSIPKLEILADDVKCSHGATVGPVDKEQLFYLMSRGLARQEAEELIVSGFFRQVVEGCSIDGVADWLSELVGKKIHGGSESDK
jgi:Fe-S cluster assembly protein SufD